MASEERKEFAKMRKRFDLSSRNILEEILSAKKDS